MPIPPFQDLMLPLLKLTSDGRERSSREVRDQLAGSLGVTTEEQAILIPSGRQALYTNRVAWALAHLKVAKVLESPARGVYRITQRGQDVLAENPARVDLRFLRRFPEFVEFRGGAQEPRAAVIDDAEQQSPAELMEASYRALRKDLAAELLTEVKRCTPAFFERLVVELLLAMGYGGSMSDAGSAVGQSGDGGIDGIIKEDRLGLDAVYIQAKRWEGTVGRPLVQAFAGGLDGRRARKGVMITTSQFSKEAYDFVASIEKRIVLVDGEKLAEYMMDYGIGVTEIVSYSVRRIDSDYFSEE